MTPQEIADYKRRWVVGSKYSLRIHSDRRREALDWCKINLSKQQWQHSKFTDVYEDTVSFESRVHYLYFLEWYGWDKV